MVGQKASRKTLLEHAPAPPSPRLCFHLHLGLDPGVVLLGFDYISQFTHTPGVHHPRNEDTYIFIMSILQPLAQSLSTVSASPSPGRTLTGRQNAAKGQVIPALNHHPHSRWTRLPATTCRPRSLTRLRGKCLRPCLRHISTCRWEPSFMTSITGWWMPTS